MDREWTPLNFGKYSGKTLPWIFRYNREWFFWAYEEEFFDKDPLKKEASEIYRVYEQKRPRKDIWCKIKEFFHYGRVIEPALKKRVEEQLQAAIKLLSNSPQKGLKNVRKTLPCQYLFLYMIHECPFFHVIGGDYYNDDRLLNMLGTRKGVRYKSLRTVEAAFKNVHFDLYNYRTAVIDGENLSNSAGIRLLKRIIADKSRKGVRCNQRTLRSLRETLGGQGVSKFILERLKWKKGKAKTTFAPGRLIFIPKKTK